MQFKDNKNNFTFSGTLSDCSFAIGSGVKDKNSIEIHPIEKAISEAKKFIYIISPYISESNVNNLITRYNTNNNIELKVLFSYNSSNHNKPDENYLKSFHKFIDKPNFKKFIKNVEEKKIQYDKKREEIQDKKSKIKSYMKFLYFLCFLCPICLGFLYYFNQFSKFTLIPLGVVFVGSILYIAHLQDKKRDLNFEKIKLNSEEASEIKKLKTVPPEIEWKNIEFKILKNKYNSSLDKEPLIHTKLYLMDCPKSENGSDMVAFLGSVNFTFSAFYQNQEFLFKTTNKDFTNKLLDYFNNLYNSDNLKTLTKEEIINFLFNAGLITYNDIKY